MLKTLIERRLTNLNHHRKRMKEKYFPDWETIVKEGEVHYPLKNIEKSCDPPHEGTIKTKQETNKAAKSESIDDDSDSTQSGNDNSFDTFVRKERLIENESTLVNDQCKDKALEEIKAMKERTKKDSQNADNHQKESVIKKESKLVGMKNSPKTVRAMEDKPKKSLPNLGGNKFLNKVAVAEENVKKLLRSPQHKQAQNAKPPPPSNKTSKGLTK